MAVSCRKADIVSRLLCRQFQCFSPTSSSLVMYSIVFPLPSFYFNSSHYYWFDFPHLLSSILYYIQEACLFSTAAAPPPPPASLRQRSAAQPLSIHNEVRSLALALALTPRVFRPSSPTRALPPAPPTDNSLASSNTRSQKSQSDERQERTAL